MMHDAAPLSVSCVPPSASVRVCSMYEDHGYLFVDAISLTSSMFSPVYQLLGRREGFSFYFTQGLCKMQDGMARSQNRNADVSTALLVLSVVLLCLVHCCALRSLQLGSDMRQLQRPALLTR